MDEEDLAELRDARKLGTTDTYAEPSAQERDPLLGALGAPDDRCVAWPSHNAKLVKRLLTRILRLAHKVASAVLWTISSGPLRRPLVCVCSNAWAGVRARVSVRASRPHADAVFWPSKPGLRHPRSARTIQTKTYTPTRRRNIYLLHLTAGLSLSVQRMTPRVWAGPHKQDWETYSARCTLQREGKRQTQGKTQRLEEVSEPREILQKYVPRRDNPDPINFYILALSYQEDLASAHSRKILMAKTRCTREPTTSETRPWLQVQGYLVAVISRMAMMRL